MTVEIVNPTGSAPPRGYSNGVVGSGRTIYVAGQIGWGADQTFSTDDFAAQFAIALDHVIAVVRAGGGEPSDIAKLTIYVTDLAEYRRSRAALGPIWRERLGRHYPAMALVGVTGLVEPLAKVEIEAVACVGDGP
jgi:enamine deaminase RidA (YjgF/YER057c/UK114 family)